MESGKFLGKHLKIGFEKVNKRHRALLSKFHCGNEAIDKYFHDEVINDKSKTTYFFQNKETSEIITLFTISCSGVRKHEESGVYTDIIPAVEIHNFATNDNYRGMPYSEDFHDGTLSHVLLSKCIEFIIQYPVSYCAAERVVLYAVPDKVSFYQNIGFEKFETYMEIKNIPYLDGCVPMFLVL